LGAAIIEGEPTAAGVGTGSGCSKMVLRVGLVCLTLGSDQTTASFFDFVDREGKIVDWFAVWSEDWPRALAGKAIKAENTSQAISRGEPRAGIGLQFTVYSYRF
jgi:hypothetical protein